MALSKITNGYVTYHLPDGSKSDVKLVTFKGINAANGYNLDYVRFVPLAVNFMIGRFIYWTNIYGKSSKDAETILLSNKDLAKNIGCNEDHAQIVMSQIKRLFGLEMYREPNRGGARRVKLNRAFIEFLKVFTEDEYTMYLNEFGLTDSEDLYALRQIFNHRLFTLRDKNLNKEQQANKEQYLEERRTHFHMVATSNVSIYGRIRLIEKYQDKISPIEQKQFERIQKEQKQGKLQHYFYMVLIKIENHVRAIKKAIENALNRNNEEETPAFTDRNKTEGEQETTKQVSAVRKKEPDQEEDSKENKPHEFQPKQENVAEYDENRTPTLKKVVTLISLWNYVADSSMPEVMRITERKVDSISKLISKYGYREVLFAIRNTAKLYYDPKRKHKMTIERLSNDTTFEYVLSRKDYHPSVSQQTKGKALSGMIHLSTIEDQCPDFRSIKESNSWFKENVLR